MDDETYANLPDYVRESGHPEYEAHLYEAYEGSFKGNDMSSSDVTSTFSYYLY